MRALAILFLVPGFSLGLIAGVTHVVGPIDTVASQQTSLVWSNRIFPTRGDFETWLVSRGSNYELWAARHPAAARHFEDRSTQSLATGSSPQSSTPHVRSMKALLIAAGSFAALLAMLALASFVRSARFLLDPPKIGLRFRGPPPMAARAPLRARVRERAPRPPRPALIEGGVHVDLREGWSGLRRVTRVTADRATEAAMFNSRLVRHHLPRVAFYAVAVILSFAIGAWIAIYLQ
jgi:hypothetical protein